MPNPTKKICPYLKKCTFGSKCRFFHPERTSKADYKTAHQIVVDEAEENKRLIELYKIKTGLNFENKPQIEVSNVVKNEIKINKNVRFKIETPEIETKIEKQKENQIKINVAQPTQTNLNVQKLPAKTKRQYTASNGMASRKVNNNNFAIQNHVNDIASNREYQNERNQNFTFSQNEMSKFPPKWTQNAINTDSHQWSNMPMNNSSLTWSNMPYMPFTYNVWGNEGMMNQPQYNSFDSKNLNSKAKNKFDDQNFNTQNNYNKQFNGGSYMPYF